MTDTARTIVRDYRLADGDIAALRALVGQRPSELGCQHLSATVDSPVLRATAVTLRLEPSFPPEWVEITTRPEELECTLFHMPVARRSNHPAGMSVVTQPDGTAATVTGEASVGFAAWGAIQAVEIVSFTQTYDDQADEHGAFTEVVSYDRALTLRFANGRTLSLSTPAPEEFCRALIEIHPSDDIGPLWADQVVETRITLN